MVEALIAGRARACRDGYRPGASGRHPWAPPATGNAEGRQQETLPGRGRRDRRGALVDAGLFMSRQEVVISLRKLFALDPELLVETDGAEGCCLIGRRCHRPRTGTPSGRAASAVTISGSGARSATNMGHPLEIADRIGVKRLNLGVIGDDDCRARGSQHEAAQLAFFAGVIDQPAGRRDRAGADEDEIRKEIRQHRGGVAAEGGAISSGGPRRRA